MLKINNLVVIVFLVSFYLVLISIYLLLSKPKNKKLLIKKSASKVNVFRGHLKSSYFCSKFSNEYKIFKKIQSAQFEFEKESLFDTYNNALKKSGIDFNIPIFKLEFYTKNNFEALVNRLYTFKSLENKGVLFNLFVFVDGYDKLKKTKQIIDIILFKRCCVRCYHCLEVDYKLLGAINFFNLNKEEEIIYRPVNGNNDLLDGGGKLIYFGESKTKKDGVFFNQTSHVNLMHGDKFNLFLSKEKFKEVGAFCGLFVGVECESIKIENYCYKNYIEQKAVELNGIKFEVCRTFDYENNMQIYVVKLQNLTNRATCAKICYGNIFKHLSPKNRVYVTCCKNGKFDIRLMLNDRRLLFFGKNFEKIIDKNFMGVIKEINLLPRQSKEIIFASFLNLDAFKEFENRGLSALNFDEAIKKYKDISLPKVFSQNKSLNNLINDYLPQKIFENTITSANSNNLDFVMLKNLIFDARVVNRDLIGGRLSSVYLLRQNLFSVYQNLLYFYFGLFPSEFGANINTDKSLVLKDATTSFEIGGQRILVRFKDFGLKNEVKINNIKYSNLKFLTFNNCKQGEVEILY